MHLLWFIIALAVTGTIFTYALPLAAAPAFLLAAILHKKSKALFYSVCAVNLLWSTYVLLTWCACTALLAEWFVFESIAPSSWRAPVVEHAWLYYAVGFTGCMAPILRMASHDLRPEPNSPLTQLKTTIHMLLCVIAFVAFIYFPRLREPWNWSAFWLTRQ